MIIPILPQEALESASNAAKGAAAGLGADAVYLSEAAELPPGAGPEALRHIAATLQARAQRVALGAMAVGAAAGRLEAYSHVLAARVEGVRAMLETEATGDARQFIADREKDPELKLEPVEAWADSAFHAWLSETSEAELAPIDAEAGKAIFVAAYLRTIRGEK